MSVLFMTGAGISASAGIPTYRDGGSSWRDKNLEQKSHASRFGNHLDELWNKHWGPVSKAMSAAEPTVAHRAIAEFQKKVPSIVATQNIDDLHERAGSDNVAHLHGIMTIKCMRCKTEADTSGWAGQGAPVCVRCGKRRTRPDVVLFGETLNKKLYNGIYAFAQTVSHLIVVGSSLNVYPATGIVMDALSTDTKTILINKEEVPLGKWFKEAHYAEADSVIEDVLGRVLNEV